MADLKQALEGLGYEAVKTHLRSGNVVLTATGKAAELERDIERAVADECGVDGVAIAVRTRDQLAEVIAGNPIPEGEAEPKRFQVSFLSAEPAKAVVDELEGMDFGDERIAFRGREVYAFHPGGIYDSPLAKLLTDKKLGVSATARNWNTVTKLLELADAEG
jgi:uncharacterized protein (DUF1697 family)